MRTEGIGACLVGAVDVRGIYIRGDLVDLFPGVGNSSRGIKRRSTKRDLSTCVLRIASWNYER